ncbi:putative cytochrome P450 monooxygenase [Aspergillus bombycis]|uniref:Putative cytochrome P450 monooxygenase n=1 Tax=Aspergillus bombycis TaxID=109264 RepID=A0A1F8A9A0_9EURO|nr:putative cytochrome P450 monooxygenase [Aspergillus bombycis]OGM47935.1 putative cytochrome P450 monooxygenase [Aspergillus bombycis]
MLGDVLDRLLTNNSVTLLVTVAVAVIALYLSPSKSNLPLVNDKKPGEFRWTNARKRFLADAHNLIRAGLAKAPVFRIVTENGKRLILDAKYANELRSHDALSFGLHTANDFHAHITGFEPFKQGSNDDKVFQDAVRMKLTQSLGNLTQPLVDETVTALQTNWTDDTTWHALPLKSSILKVVAQLSSRIFLGDQICRNPNWLRITVDYTIDSFKAAEALRLWPKAFRAIVAQFLPSCRKIRAELQEAQDIIWPVLDARRRDKQAAISGGKEPERYNDAMEWLEECAKGRSYEPAFGQLIFSVAAIHTTSDMLTQVLYDLCGRNELIQALREEVITVVQEEGWKKPTLYKLKLMDSVLKESQRLKPIGVVSMRRVAMADLKLSDGTSIPKGSFLAVSSERMWDPEIYPNPLEFDGYRFLKLREVPGHETSAQTVAPSPEHMGFGFGRHACPGRFFAVNEVKIALCHILLKYEFKLADGSVPRARQNGVSLNADPMIKLMIRRRQEEIAL